MVVSIEVDARVAGVASDTGQIGRVMVALEAVELTAGEFIARTVECQVRDLRARRKLTGASRKRRDLRRTRTVPVRRASTLGQGHERLFLPFEDAEDEKVGEVISKVLLLLKDDEITDKSILRQFRRG